ncbi:hypothetical protein CR513_45272, partial [Mucuna pruriens]
MKTVRRDHLRTLQVKVHSERDPRICIGDKGRDRSRYLSKQTNSSRGTIATISRGGSIAKMTELGRRRYIRSIMAVQVEETHPMDLVISFSKADYNGMLPYTRMIRWWSKYFSTKRARPINKFGGVFRHAHRLCRRASGDLRDDQSTNHLWPSIGYKDRSGQVYDHQCMGILQRNIGPLNAKLVVGNSVYAPPVHEVSNG